MLKDVPKKIERDRERGKGLTRKHKNCVLNEWEFVEEEVRRGRGRGLELQSSLERCACIDARDFTSDTREHLMH